MTAKIKFNGLKRIAQVRKFSQAFSRFAERISRYAGKPAAFLVAVGVVVWAASGPMFHFGNTWQLVISTGR